MTPSVAEVITEDWISLAVVLNVKVGDLSVQLLIYHCFADLFIVIDGEVWTLRDSKRPVLPFNSCTICLFLDIDTGII